MKETIRLRCVQSCSEGVVLHVICVGKVKRFQVGCHDEYCDTSTVGPGGMCRCRVLGEYNVRKCAADVLERDTR